MDKSGERFDELPAHIKREGCDRMFRKPFFLGNVAFAADRKDFEDALSKEMGRYDDDIRVMIPPYADVEDIIIPESDGRPRGYAFVTLAAFGVARHNTVQFPRHLCTVTRHAYLWPSHIRSTCQTAPLKSRWQPRTCGEPSVSGGGGLDF